MSTPSKAYWVKWVDSATHEGHAWRTKKDLDALAPPICEMVGFLYKTTADYIVFISCRNMGGEEDQELWGELVVPHGAILEMRPLRLGKAINPRKVKKDETK